MMPAVLFAARHKKAAAAQNAAIRPLTERERALQALNRLTFGPRPGDVDRVMAMGVDKWIDLQLDPQKIDDSALDAQLAGYPAIAMPLQDLIERYPADSLVRAVADGKRPSPVDPVERAIYNNQVADYEQRKEKKADQAAQNGGTAQTPQPAMSMQAPAMEPAAGPGMETENKPKRMAYTGPDAGEILALPPAERWNRLVAMNPEEFRSFFQGMRPQDRLQVTDGMTPQQKEVVYALVNPTQLVTGELLQTRLLTDIYSERQLQAVMTDFWLNHFNVYLRKGPLAPWYLVDYERNIVAPRAMGKFEDLLVATAQSPAMLFYLDNHASIGPDSQAAVRARMNPKNNNQDPGLNENYGRELMELHTLGVDGGYTQKDVTEVAKVFTGWTIQDGADGGQFVFNDRRHEPGPKHVLGKTIQDGGEREGMEVLHMLATSPATAHHLSQELAVRFVSDNPPPELVDRMAQTYLHTGGDIREVLRTMFHSPEFWSADAYRVKVKTPEEFVISAVRASQGEVVRPALLLNAMNKLGMSFFGCQTPNGYSWKADGWVNTGDLLDRMNLALALASNRQGTAVDLDALLKADNPGAQLVDQKETELEQAFLEEPLSDQTRSAVLNQVAAVMGPAGPARAQPLGAGMNAAKGQGKGASLERKAAMVQMIDLPEAIPPPQDNQAAALAGLLLGSPDFQKK
jgi:uncharacterized protein (DUF1800 family)